VKKVSLPAVGIKISGKGRVFLWESDQVLVVFRAIAFNAMKNNLKKILNNFNEVDRRYA